MVIAQPPVSAAALTVPATARLVHRRDLDLRGDLVFLAGNIFRIYLAIVAHVETVKEALRVALQFADGQHAIVVSVGLMEPALEPVRGFPESARKARPLG